MRTRKESFTAGQASRITRVSYRNLDHWARTQFISPSIADANGAGSERLYSFDDLVALRVARELRSGGVSTQALRRIIKFLRDEKGLQNPLAESRLLVAGSDVVMLVKNCEQAMSVLNKPDQGVFAFMVDLRRTVSEIKKSIADIHAA